MSNKVLYAVYSGYDKEKNKIVTQSIYNSWKEVKEVVDKVSKKDYGVAPIYKKVHSVEEAKSFFDECLQKDSLRNKSHIDFPKDTFHLFTDGSFSKELEKYSSGLVLLQGEKVLLEYKLASKDNLYKEYYQIPGELKAVILGLKLVTQHFKPKHIVIYHDYMGVKCHATGEWDRDNKLSEDYYKWYQDFIEEHEHIHIEFIKVDAHKGNKYNERADELAKEALKELKNISHLV